MSILTESWKKEISNHKNLIILSTLFLAVAIIINYDLGKSYGSFKIGERFFKKL